MEKKLPNNWVETTLDIVLSRVSNGLYEAYRAIVRENLLNE